MTFLLALALVITRRQGLTIFLRAAAAALLVPSLAVVIIALGAELLDVSASPITLPVIAVVVAAVLPTTGLIASALVKNGLSEGARPRRPALDRDLDARHGCDRRHSRLRPRCRRAGDGVPGVRHHRHRRGRHGDLGRPSLRLDRRGSRLDRRALDRPRHPRRLGDRHRALRAAAGTRRGRRRGDPGRPRPEGRRRPLRDRPRCRRRVVAGRARDRRVGNGCGASRGARSACWPGPRSCSGSVRLIKGGSEDKPNRFLPLRRPTLVIAIAAAASGAIQGIRYGSGVEELPSFLDPTYVMLTVLAFALVATALAARRRTRRGHGTRSSRGAGALVVPGRRGLPGRGPDERDQPDAARHLDRVVAHDGAARPAGRDRRSGLERVP